MANNILKQLKELISEFVDNQGVIRETPLGRSIKIELSKDRLDFLRQFIDLLINTDYLTEETKVYIKNKYITAEGVYDELKEKYKDINLNTVKSKIYYDKVNKIVAKFSEKMLADVIEYKNSDITSYKRVLSEIRNKKCGSKLLDNIALKLPKPEASMRITEGEFEEFIEIILPYTRRHMQEISNMLNPQVIGYIHWILSSELLTEVDLKHRAKINEILGGGEE